MLAIFFYLKSRRTKRLDFTWSKSTLQSKKHPDIKIFFRNVEISDLSRHDIPSRLHGKIFVEGVDGRSQFLSAACIDGDIDATRATADIAGPTDATFEFEYMDPGHRFVAELLFSGEQPKINAALIGGSIRVRNVKDALPSLSAWAVLFTSIGVMLSLLSMVPRLRTLTGPWAWISMAVTTAVWVSVIFGLPEVHKRLEARRKKRSLEDYLS